MDNFRRLHTMLSVASCGVPTKKKVDNSADQVSHPTIMDLIVERSGPSARTRTWTDLIDAKI